MKVIITNQKLLNVWTLNKNYKVTVDCATPAISSKI